MDNLESLKNDDGIPIKVDEGESIRLEGTLTKPGGVALEEGNLESLTVTLLNKSDNSVINSRNEQNIINANGGTIDEEGNFTFTLSASDNILLDESARTEEHILIFKFSWLDDQNNEQDGIRKYNLTVYNTESADEEIDPLSTASGLDLTGIKRVKTKHIEIEAFDPIKVQEARDKENASLPTFCSSNFCVGVPRTKRRFSSDN